MYQSLFFNKVAKKRFWHKCFLLNFTTFPRTTFLQNTSGRLLHCSIILFNHRDQLSWRRVSKSSKTCEKWAYWPLYFFWLLHFHFAAPNHDITFSRIVCSILYNKYFFPFKMLSSSNGNDSETYKTVDGLKVHQMKTNTIQTGNCVRTERKLSI